MAQIKCPDCGKEIQPSENVCPNCGCPIENIEINSNPAGMHCPDCGAVVDNTMDSCPNCGCILKTTNRAVFVESSLLPDEKILCVAKWHWINYVLPILFMLVGIILILVSFADFDDLWYLFLLGILGGLFGFLGILEMKKFEFVVTTKRIFIKMGIILRASYELRIEKLESIQVYQGILGRILNFGIVLVHGVGASRQMAGMLVDPMGFRQHIFSELSRQNNSDPI